MTWADDILERATAEPLLINGSKTPSGVAHVGSLRGVLIHDAIAKIARSGGREARFTYGCDDMDPLDEKPHGSGDFFDEHLGKPLHAVPAPPGLQGSNMARAYFGEFVANFEPLGVEAEFYYMSEVYAAGRLDEVIDTFLRNGDKVREIYLRETGAVRSDDWLPLQPICEACGRIGTTYASDYDGETVGYRCEPDLVSWATGCGGSGRVSPFGGKAKLPWKLEWAAKWHVLPVNLEGAGKDHMGAGGSFKVSSALAREVLGIDPPQSFVYEFFTLDGSKMSSSLGIGMSATELTQMLPAELLRYTILRVQPRKAFEFSLGLTGLNRAFVEYERLWQAIAGGEATENQTQLFAVSQSVDAGEGAPAFSPPFDSVVSIASQPHIDLDAHLASLGRENLSEVERSWLRAKHATALAWSQSFLGEAAELQVSESLPDSVGELDQGAREFFNAAAQGLAEVEDWVAQDIQAALFDAIRSVGLEQADAFKAFYLAFFDADSGPRAGSFLEFYGRDATIERLSGAGAAG